MITPALSPGRQGRFSSGKEQEESSRELEWHERSQDAAVSTVERRSCSIGDVGKEASRAKSGQTCGPRSEA